MTFAEIGEILKTITERFAALQQMKFTGGISFEVNYHEGSPSDFKVLTMERFKRKKKEE